MLNTNTLLFLLFSSGFLLGFLFQLRWYYLLFIGILYFIVLGHIKKSQQKQRKELESFQLINSYMSQVSQSFVRTKNILSALQEKVHRGFVNFLLGNARKSLTKRGRMCKI